MAPHPPVDRLSKLDCPTTNSERRESDTCSDRPRQDVSKTAMFCYWRRRGFWAIELGKSVQRGRHLSPPLGVIEVVSAGSHVVRFAIAGEKGRPSGRVECRSHAPCGACRTFRCACPTRLGYPSPGISKQTRERAVLAGARIAMPRSKCSSNSSVCPALCVTGIFNTCRWPAYCPLSPLMTTRHQPSRRRTVSFPTYISLPFFHCLRLYHVFSWGREAGNHRQVRSFLSSFGDLQQGIDSCQLSS